MSRPPPYECQSDVELLQAGRAGNGDAFVALYRRLQGAVFRFAFHMSGSREAAEDAVQEAFLVLLADQLAFVAGRGPLEAFLIGVARNQLRRRHAEVRRFQPLDPQEDGWPAALQPTSESELDGLRDAVLRLPEPYRAVTVLCDLEELSYADAAQRLGCAVGTVRSRLHRSRAILERKLKRSKPCPI